MPNGDAKEVIRESILEEAAPSAPFSATIMSLLRQFEGLLPDERQHDAQVEANGPLS